MTQTSFAELGVAPDLAAALAAQGITSPFPVQALTIPDALAGTDLCGRAKTGSGKTLAFGLPVLQTAPPGAPMRPSALVLVPTRELASQVRDVLAPLGEAVQRKVVAIYGGARMDRQLAQLRAGADVVIATPGRLIDLVANEGLTLEAVRTVVLDEADRMFDMGFLPQVEWVLRHVPKERQTLLFSATLDGAVDLIVRRYLNDPVRHEVVSETVTVDEMIHRFLKVHEMDRVRVAAAIVRAHRRTLLFVNTKRQADRFAQHLSREGVKVAAIHGDLRQQARERALADFAAGSLSALVATDVAARGIHVDDVDCVVHVDPPDDPKTYLHRSGRTARAGEQGTVVTLVLWNQEVPVRRLQRMLRIDQPMVEVFSNDPRLADLRAWDPAADAAGAPTAAGAGRG